MLVTRSVKAPKVAFPTPLPSFLSSNVGGAGGGSDDDEEDDAIDIVSGELDGLEVSASSDPGGSESPGITSFSSSGSGRCSAKNVSLSTLDMLRCLQALRRISLPSVRSHSLA
jgi:hypothetical protein